MRAVGGPRRRRPVWFTGFVVALLVVPLLEVYVIVQVGRVVGAWPTVGMLLALSALGAWLVRREGGRTWEALRSALQTSRMPVTALADAALVLIGGVLLLAPGFVTDAAGLFLLLPLSRPLARRWLEIAVERRVAQRIGLVRGETL